MDMFQIIVLLNLSISVGYFIVTMIILKLSGINPVGIKVKTKNKFGIFSVILSTLLLYFLWLMYIINSNISLQFLSLELLTKSLYIKWIAVSIMTISTAVIIISSLSLGKSGRIFSPIEKIKLIKTGIYGTIRNPIVLGMFLYGLSILLLNPNLLSILMIIFLIYGYNYKVDTEAIKLEEMFGDEWDVYCRNVGKYLPKLFSK
jgi:protein-S-isoprenylcysteine O-methyltransferase Ste14